MIHKKKLALQPFITIFFILLAIAFISVIGFFIRTNRSTVENQAQVEPEVKLMLTADKTSSKINQPITIEVKVADIVGGTSTAVAGIALGIKLPKPITLNSSESKIETFYKDITTAFKGDDTEIQILLANKQDNYSMVQKDQSILSFTITSPSATTGLIEFTTGLNYPSIIGADLKEKLIGKPASSISVTFDNIGATGTVTPSVITPTGSITPTVSPTITGTLSPTVSPTQVLGTNTPAPTNASTLPISNVTVDFTLFFQGVTSVLPQTNQEVSVKLFTEDKKVIDSSKVRVDLAEDGIWYGSKNYTNIDISKNYYFIIKGSKHIAKKICSFNPQETEPGKYICANNKITLVSGKNFLTATAITLIAGDIPTQNGVIDSLDIGFIRQNLGKKTIDILKKGDINFDGIVDTQDYSLVFNSLTRGFKYDEE